MFHFCYIVVHACPFSHLCPSAGDTLTHKYPKDYRLGVAFTLAQPYGFTRIMSSYYFDEDTDAGPPHLSDYR